MPNEKILSELYHGNLNSVAKSVVPGGGFQKYQHQLSDLKEEILAMLDEQGKEKFTAFVTTQGNLNLISGEERFTDGFCIGAKFMFKIFEHDDGQLKPFTGQLFVIFYSRNLI